MQLVPEKSFRLDRRLADLLVNPLKRHCIPCAPEILFIVCCGKEDLSNLAIQPQFVSPVFLARR